MKSNSNVIRWGGLAAMLGGVFWVVWSNLFRAGFEAAGGPISDALLLLAALLTLAGLVGLNALQGGNYGSIGQAGFYTAAAGLFILWKPRIVRCALGGARVCALVTKE